MTTASRGKQSKDRRRLTALRNNEQRDRRNQLEQLRVLNVRLGDGQGAKRERARLHAQRVSSAKPAA